MAKDKVEIPPSPDGGKRNCITKLVSLLLISGLPRHVQGNFTFHAGSFRLAAGSMTSHHLMLYLFEHFVWMDEQLQTQVRAKGWPDISRSQSMVLLNISAGTVRPSDIARKLGISRQAVHTTIRQLSNKDIVRLERDGSDGRHRRLVLTETGQRMRHDAQAAVESVTRAVEQRLGKQHFADMMAGLAADWT